MAVAKRVLTEKPAAGNAERITHAFRIAIGRAPEATELGALTKLFESERAARAADPKDTKEFLGDFALPPQVKPEVFAAWYAVATALLNLDETITKN
jgi:hypothetical protein